VFGLIQGLVFGFIQGLVFGFSQGLVLGFIHPDPKHGSNGLLLRPAAKRLSGPDLRLSGPRGLGGVGFLRFVVGYSGPRGLGGGVPKFCFRVQWSLGLGWCGLCCGLCFFLGLSFRGARVNPRVVGSGLVVCFDAPAQPPAAAAAKSPAVFQLVLP